MSEGMIVSLVEGQGQTVSANALSASAAIPSAGGPKGPPPLNATGQTPAEAAAAAAAAAAAELEKKRAQIIKDHVANAKPNMTKAERIADRDALYKELLNADPNHDVLLLQEQMIDLRQNVLPVDLRDDLTVVNVNRYLDGIAIAAARDRGGPLTSTLATIEHYTIFKGYDALKKYGLQPRGKYEASPYDPLQDESYDQGAADYRRQTAAKAKAAASAKE